jgi:hypothetical protein
LTKTFKVLRLIPAFAALPLLAIGGCFGGGDLRCEDVMRYGTSGTAAQIRVPEDLSLPNESEALQIPNAPPLDLPDPETDPEGATECLERPPDFFEQ